MSFHQTRTGEIFYQVLGHGEPLLLLRGLGRSSRYWLGFEKHLAQHFRVIIMDQRGLGRTRLKAQWSDTIGTLARDGLQLMDALQIKRFHVFGLSLGGMIGLEMAALAAHRVASLVVANSSSRDYRGFRVHPRALKALILGSLRGRFQEALMEQLIAVKAYQERGREIGLLWRIIVQDEGVPWMSIGKQTCAALRFTIRGRLDATHTPILFLSGDEDRLVPNTNSWHLHHLFPGSDFRLLKGAGHEITIGCEEDVTQILLHFISKVTTE